MALRRLQFGSNRISPKRQGDERAVLDADTVLAENQLVVRPLGSREGVVMPAEALCEIDRHVVFVTREPIAEDVAVQVCNYNAVRLGQVLACDAVGPSGFLVTVDCGDSSASLGLPDWCKRVH